MLSRFKWMRDPANPVLPPDPDSRYDCSQCMNPFRLPPGCTIPAAMRRGNSNAVSSRGPTRTSPPLHIDRGICLTLSDKTRNSQTTCNLDTSEPWQIV